MKAKVKTVVSKSKATRSRKKAGPVIPPRRKGEEPDAYAKRMEAEMAAPGCKRCGGRPGHKPSKACPEYVDPRQLEVPMPHAPTCGLITAVGEQPGVCTCGAPAVVKAAVAKMTKAAKLDAAEAKAVNAKLKKTLSKKERQTIKESEARKLEHVETMKASAPNAKPDGVPDKPPVRTRVGNGRMFIVDIEGDQDALSKWGDAQDGFIVHLYDSQGMAVLQVDRTTMTTPMGKPEPVPVVLFIPLEEKSGLSLHWLSPSEFDQRYNRAVATTAPIACAQFYEHAKKFGATEDVLRYLSRLTRINPTEVTMAVKKEAKKGVAKGNKKSGEKTGRKPGSGARIRELILAGKEADAILATVHKEFPGSKAAKSDVSWNKGWLKRKGLLKEPKKAKATAEK